MKIIFDLFEVTNIEDLRKKLDTSDTPQKLKDFETRMNEAKLKTAEANAKIKEHQAKWWDIFENPPSPSAVRAMKSKETIDLRQEFEENKKQNEIEKGNELSKNFDIRYEFSAWYVTCKCELERDDINKISSMCDFVKSDRSRVEAMQIIRNHLKIIHNKDLYEEVLTP